MSFTLATESQKASAGDETNQMAANMVIRQDPFNVTLDALALLAVSILLVLGMHFIDRPVLEFLIILIPLALLIHNDYLNFLKLGPGGTPPTPSGYARLTWYRLFTLRDPFTAPPRDPTQQPATGILSNLPYRPGPRPIVAGLAPQRQLNQHGSLPASTALRAALESLCARVPDKFVTATSSMEKHGFALFARHPLNVCGNGEVCHIHTSDRSMHLNLHPDDIKEVLDKGWGQRHPMAWDGLIQSPLPRTYTMIYAPRDENDLRIVCRIIEAAIWYTTAEKSEILLTASVMLEYWCFCAALRFKQNIIAFMRGIVTGSRQKDQHTKYLKN
ncbi:hypothetical protein N657DRAFT_630370 [Parathielavia appendiculata]|uniref:Luciferase domain-containing protein n=1 Tax=Parathielavia appendiculata TaxID=2587402 RepID=A0AAN6UBI6_9PEZI|nr:hypothetical protein N657DRAFT_630370 [Parathielavia appendiculata]